MSETFVESSAIPVLRAEDFRPYHGQIFAVEAWPYRLALREISESPATAGFRAPFSLIFEGPPGAILPEGLRRIVGADGAAFVLYLMPVHTPHPGRQDYQAVFN
jgi:hypothetical protein